MLSDILTRRNVLLATAIIAGLLFPRLPEALTRFTALALVVTVITVYLNSVDTKVVANGRLLFSASLLAILFSYVLLGNVLVWTGTLLMFSYNTIWAGFVVLAVAPPVFPELLPAKIFHGRLNLLLSKTIGAYVAGMVISPLMFGVLIDDALFDGKSVAVLGVALTVIPLALVTITKKFPEIFVMIEENKSNTLDVCLALIVFLMTSANAEMLTKLPYVLAPVFATILFSTFVLGKAILGVCSFFHVSAERSVETVFAGTLKDGFIAGGIALSLLPPEASLPALVYCLNLSVYCAWLEKTVGGREHRQNR